METGTEEVAEPLDLANGQATALSTTTASMTLASHI